MIYKLKNTDIELIKELTDKFSDIFLYDTIKNDFLNNSYTNYYIYTIDEKIVGFINYYDIYDRFEIVNFSVLEYFRNRHIGTKLLKKVIELASQKKVINITLEVRKDNERAIHLYEKFGFQKVCLRKNYYQGVDGILMKKDIN